MKQQSKTIQKKVFIGILCSVILIFLDQFTKYLAVQHLKDQMPVVLWKNVLELSYLENRGAAFGIFQGKQWPLIIFTVIVLILIIYFYLMRIPGKNILAYSMESPFCFLQVRSVTLLTGLRRDMWLISFISD